MSSLSNLKRERERFCNTKGSSNQYMDQMTCTYMKRVAQVSEYSPGGSDNVAPYDSLLILFPYQPHKVIMYQYYV